MKILLSVQSGERTGAGMLDHVRWPRFGAICAPALARDGHVTL